MNIVSPILLASGRLKAFIDDIKKASKEFDNEDYDHAAHAKLFH